MGHLDPLRLEQMTIDQVLICMSNPDGDRFISPAEAIAQGLMEPGGKTGVEMALEEAARLEKERMRDAKRKKRRQMQANAVNSQPGG